MGGYTLLDLEGLRLISDVWILSLLDLSQDSSVKTSGWDFFETYWKHTLAMWCYSEHVLAALKL